MAKTSLYELTHTEAPSFFLESCIVGAWVLTVWSKLMRATRVLLLHFFPLYGVRERGEWTGDTERRGGGGGG